MKKVLLSTCFLVLFIQLAFSQSFRLSGRVTDEDGLPVELAVVSLNRSLWVTTDKDGKYEFSNLKKGKYEYLVSFVGFKEINGSVELASSRTMDFRLQALSLVLDSVTVTAEREDLGSKSVINEEAVRHLQPKSVSDLLQLVPGNLARNPNLNELSQASVREIDPKSNASLGTSVIVDGTPLSNDANLQAIASTRYGSASGTQTDGMSDQTTAGGGADLRTVSAGVVESMEVISGIPSAEYGNLTSGVVIVKTKAGRTPWEIKSQIDPQSKLVYLGKGFALKRGGSFNIGGDWSQSYADPRRKYLGYDRLTAAAGYSKVWNRASLHVRGSVYSNVNERKTDPQLAQKEINYTNRNMGFRLSASGSFQPGKDAFLSSLDYNFSTQASRTEDLHESKVWSPDGAVTDTRESGLHQAAQKIKPYYAAYSLHGVPVNVFAQLIAGKYFQTGQNDYNKIRAGVEYTLDVNLGRGFTYDAETPPQAASAHTLRPRAYKDIPALNTLSAFVTDKGRLSLGGRTALKSEVGLRVSSLKGYFVVEPRLNLSLGLLDEALSLNAGFGISNKMPPLLYLYPEPAYYDFICLNRYSEVSGTGLAVIDTQIVNETSNPDLRPAHAVKRELGLSWKTKAATGFVTFFHETHTDEFGYDGQLYYGKYKQFVVPDGATDLALEGNKVFYTLSGARQAADEVQKMEFSSWSRPSNNARRIKYGIEYGLDLGTIRPIRTSVSINGAWFHIQRTRETASTSYRSKIDLYAPMMPAGRGTVQNRVNTSFRFITHIPEVKLVLTTTLQVVWYESLRSVYLDENGHSRAFDYTYQGKDYLAVEPLGFYDRDGQFTAWNGAAMNADPALNYMLDRFYTYGFLPDVVEPWALLNIRLTKEIGSHAQISFTANNVTNTSRYHVDRNSQSKTQLYPSMYFGAEIKINL
jgi:hypothetical protein